MRVPFLLATTVAMAFSFSSLAQMEEAKQPQLNIYAASKEYLVEPVLDLFTKETGIKVNITTIDNMALSARLEMEGEDTPADAVIVTDVAKLYDLQAHDVLYPFQSEVVEKNIPSVLRAKDNSWVGIATRARLVYRRNDDTQAEITDYRELADPKWKDGVLIRSSDSVYNQSLLADIIYRYGEEEALKWAKGVTANMARKPSGGDRDQLRALASGQGRLAVGNSYYYALMLTSDDESDRAYADKITPMFMEGDEKYGTHINIRGIGIAKHSHNKEAAKKLVEFMTQPEAQRFITLHNYEYPANPAVEPAGVLNKWPFTPNPRVDLSEVGKRNAKAVELFSEAGWQ